MPVNYAQLMQILPAAVGKIPAWQVSISQKIELARQVYVSAQNRQEELTQVVDHLVNKIDPLVQTARPGHEPLAACYPPAEITAPLTLVCSDASQMLPSESQLGCGLVNTVAASMRIFPDDSEMPIVRIETELFLQNDRFTPGGVLQSDDSVDLYRDVRERELLAEMAIAHTAEAPVFALLDSTLELWGSHNPALTGHFGASVNRNRKAFEQMRDQGIYICGYVESQVSNLLVHFLEIAMTPKDQLPSVRQIHPLAGISDSMVLADLLPSGHRTAVFKLKTRTLNFDGPLSTNLFFMNVGSHPIPKIVRIEIPEFFCQSADIIGLLQAVTLRQVSIVPTTRYVYLLGRCHELAQIPDREYIENLIRGEYLRQHLAVPQATEKSWAKRLIR